MARALGLDLGTHSVKAMVIETAARGARLLSYFEAARGEGDPAETLVSALRALLERLPAGVEPPITALAGSVLALHTLSFPFADAKRLEAALPFELESQLPFELSTAVYDYQRIGPPAPPGGAAASSELIIGLVRKEELVVLLAPLDEVGLSPRVVTHPALAYHHLLLFTPQIFGDPSPDQRVAVLDLGHERTCLAIGRPGSGVESARTFGGGGKDLTRALATEFKSAFADAETWKEAHGAIGDAANGPESERASAAFQRGLQTIVRETRATLKGDSAHFHAPISRLYLCGGTSRLPGIAEHLSKELGIPAQLLGLPQEVEASASSRQTPFAAQAYALALRGTVPPSRAPRFNLRRGAFTFKRDSDSARGHLLRLGLFGAALIALFLVFAITRNTLLGRREKEVDRQLCVVTERVLGHCEPNYEKALNLLQGKESPIAAVPRRSAVNLLAELNDRVPKEASVQFDQVVIDLERLQLRGQTDSPHQIDTLSRALKDSPCFREIKEGKVEKTRDGQHVSFRLDVEVKCAEEGHP